MCSSTNYKSEVCNGSMSSYDILMEKRKGVCKWCLMGRKHIPRRIEQMPTRPEDEMGVSNAHVECGRCCAKVMNWLEVR